MNKSEPASFAALCRRQPPETWTRPVCLSVDEIQGIDAAASEVLNKLHNGMRVLPVLTVLAGLGDIYDHLFRRVGLTRPSLDAVNDIGCLEPEEAVVLGALYVFRVDAAERNADAWAARLAEESWGWALHLHNGLRALAEGLIEFGRRIAGIDAVSVLEREAEFRRIRYRRRVSPEMEAARCLIGAVIQDVAAGVECGAVLGSIDKHNTRTERNEPRLWRLPDGMTTEAFLGHLIHRGALQQSQDYLFRCPIPSFRD